MNDCNSDDWGLPGSRSMELRDPRILALAAAQRRFLESEYDEYSPIHSGSSTCCRSLVLIVSSLFSELKKTNRFKWIISYGFWEVFVRFRFSARIYYKILPLNEPNVVKTLKS